jgi:hypothetical protein
MKNGKKNDKKQGTLRPWLFDVMVELLRCRMTDADLFGSPNNTDRLLPESGACHENPDRKKRQ